MNGETVNISKQIPRLRMTPLGMTKGDVMPSDKIWSLKIAS
jgi:hypothetical protein